MSKLSAKVVRLAAFSAVLAGFTIPMVAHATKTCYYTECNDGACVTIGVPCTQ